MNRTQGPRFFLFFLSFVLALSLFAPIPGFSAGWTSTDKRAGKGIHVADDGSKYEGDYAAGNAPGKGVLTYPDVEAAGWVLRSCHRDGNQPA